MTHLVNKDYILLLSSELSVRNFTVRYALVRGKEHLKDYFS